MNKLVHARAAIEFFVKHSLDASYHINWPTLIPGSVQKGWGARKVDWRIQCDAIVADFNIRAGSNVSLTLSDKDTLRMVTLSLFGLFLAERG
jgi:hypothetical protein